jgi:8-oxo-dGTP pyrophosphatase MutT (NUDIX family)
MKTGSVEPRRFWGNRAVGIVIQNNDNKVLLLKRSVHTENNKAGSVWGVSGGKVDEGHNLQSAARNEMEEELGSIPPGKFTGKSWDWKTKMNIGDYRSDTGYHVKKDNEWFTYTFLHYMTDVDSSWTPELNWEHDDYKWCDPKNLNSPRFIAIDHEGNKIDTVAQAVLKLFSARTIVKEALEEVLLILQRRK